MTGPLAALEALLTEVEAIAAVIMQGELAAVDAGVAEWALETCRVIRDALTDGDAAGAAVAGYQLGERLAEIRALGRAAAYKSKVQRDHERDFKRRKAYFAALRRGFSPTEAYEKAAEVCGTSAKTIMRAVKG